MTSLLLETVANGDRITASTLAAAVFELAEEGELGITYTPTRVILARQSTAIDNLDNLQHALRRIILPHSEQSISTATAARPTFTCISKMDALARKGRPRRERATGALRDSTISLLLWGHGDMPPQRLIGEIAEWVSENRRPSWWRTPGTWSAGSATPLLTTYQSLVRSFA